MTRIDDKILLRRYHEDGDLQAREQLIEQYMSLVRSPGAIRIAGSSSRISSRSARSA
jgi:DNA-directed RNA polymerase specialized sigma subunit